MPALRLLVHAVLLTAVDSYFRAGRKVAFTEYHREHVPYVKA